jgi:phosphosulfolactate phosphohydrolase-like enzyme
LNDKRGRFMMGHQKSGKPDQRELDNSPIAIATREFVGAVTGKAP